MQSTVEVRDRRPVLVRTGSGTAATTIRQEAQTLSTIAGPGTPMVVELIDDGEQVQLVIAVAPPLNLLTAPLGTAVDALARIADVLQRANACGIAHGPIRDEDVLGDGVSVLLSGWQRASDAHSAHDVAEFGRLVERVAVRHTQLDAIAARALAPDAPTCAALAAALRALLPPDEQRPRVLPAWPFIAALAVAIAATALGLTHTAPHRPGKRGVVLMSPTSVAVHGNIVERAGHRWHVGEPGDVVVTGSWNCDGEDLPAVLRPRTGRIWLFTDWPSGSAPRIERRGIDATGAIRLRVKHEAQCDRLLAEDGQGRATVVR